MLLFLLAGMKDIEVRRFLRLRSEVFHAEKLSAPNSQLSNLTEGLKWKEPQQRWKDTKYGYVPFAKHERVTFMNDKVLPAFFKCQFRLAKNQKDFVKNSIKREGGSMSCGKKLSRMMKSYRISVMIPTLLLLGGVCSMITNSR